MLPSTMARLFSKYSCFYIEALHEINHDGGKARRVAHGSSGQRCQLCSVGAGGSKRQYSPIGYEQMGFQLRISQCDKHKNPQPHQHLPQHRRVYQHGPQSAAAYNWLLRSTRVDTSLIQVRASILARAGMEEADNVGTANGPTDPPQRRSMSVITPAYIHVVAP